MGLRRSGESHPEPHQRHADSLAAVRRAVLHSDGASDRATRSAAADGGELPERLHAYLAAVRDESYRITDGQLAALKAGGVSEEEIFEVTVAAALGASLRRLDAGLRAIRGEPDG